MQQPVAGAGVPATGNHVGWAHPPGTSRRRSQPVQRNTVVPIGGIGPSNPPTSTGSAAGAVPVAGWAVPVTRTPVTGPRRDRRLVLTAGVLLARTR